MKRSHYVQFAVAAIASLGFTLPPQALAAEASRTAAPAGKSETASSLDISLSAGGTLVGEVVNAQGAPLTEMTVTVRQSGADVASAVTDNRGSFSIGGLQGGLFEVNAAGGTGVFRLWTAGTSPPSARGAILIVAGEPVNRGQYFSRNWYGSRLTNGQVLFGTAVILGVTAAVVANSVNNLAQPSGS